MFVVCIFCWHLVGVFAFMTIAATVISAVMRSKAEKSGKLQLVVPPRSEVNIENGTQKPEYSKLLNEEEDDDF